MVLADGGVVCIDEFDKVQHCRKVVTFAYLLGCNVTLCIDETG